MPSFHLCFSTRDAERGRSRGPLIPRWGSFHSPPIRILQLLKKPKYFLPGIPSWLKQPATALWLLVFARSRGIVMRCGEGGGERPVGWFTRQEIPINHCPNLSKGSGGCSEFPLVVPVTWCSDAFFFLGGMHPNHPLHPSVIISMEPEREPSIFGCSPMANPKEVTQF